ncbi:unnamed protein product [Brachionus calyciflorus]|uniref:ISXO2-like transposase domain-containing protein n=1 Tax=Brachionus calyciflorus TaxID=104777 RepID=A0A814FKN5_9BILA|nr:unnamed protein product [Brachionus calyciflorus]
MDFKDLSEFDPYKLIMHLMSTGILLGEQFCQKFIDYWSKERKKVDMESSIKISRPVLIKICHFLRQLVVLDLDKENFQIGGPGEIVEIEESVFNKEKYNNGKDLVHYKKEKQIWAVKNREAKTLIPLICKHIKKQSIIYSDEWRSYFKIKKLKQNYHYLTVNHSKQFIDRRTGCHTNGIEGLWNKCKSRFRSMNGVNRRFLQEYLDEVMWRINECTVFHKDKKKQVKYSRHNVFKRIMNLLHVKNIEIFRSKIKELDEIEKATEAKEKKRALRAKFLSDEFIIKSSRILNRDMLLNDPISLISRSTQTDASVFNYYVKSKKQESKLEQCKIFDELSSLTNASTQTDMSPFIDQLIDRKKYNLRKKNS